MIIEEDPRSQDPTALARLIKQEAQRLGFQLVGITSPDPPPHLDIYHQWIEANRHGEMAYLASSRAIEKRENPRTLLPECRSILVVGMNCLPSVIPANSEAKVAAYAQGDDYHDVILEKLQSLVQFIKTQYEDTFKYKIYVDTGPILERELAQRAGLGWIGKNTCLINPKLGSHFLLAEVLLGIFLPSDPPFYTDHCGSCTRCIDQCPTACILPDRTIDARRCISYLTIEYRGEIPGELRAKMGNWLFGCDICQDVCPWNQRFSKTTDDPAFQPRPFLQDGELEKFLALSPQSYTAELRASPLKRPKRAGLLRNASVVAGNNKSEGLIPLLEHLILKEDDAIVRAHAIWALGQIGGEKAKVVLEKAETKLKDPKHISQIKTILEEEPPGSSYKPSGG